MKWIANLTIKRNWFVLALFLVLTVLIGYGLTTVTFEDSLDVMQPDESELARLNEDIRVVLK